jgi:hypothetical protein
MAILESETIMDDNTPVYYGYIYIADGVIVRNYNIFEGTIKDLKKELNAKEIRRCELFAPERSNSKIGDMA